MHTTNRRHFLRAGTAVAAFAILTRRGDAAEFTWRATAERTLRAILDAGRERHFGR